MDAKNSSRIMQIFPRQEAFKELEQNFSDFDLNSVKTCLAFLNATSEVYAAFDAHFERYGLSAGRFTVLMSYTLQAGYATIRVC